MSRCTPEHTTVLLMFTRLEGRVAAASVWRTQHCTNTHFLPPLFSLALAPAAGNVHPVCASTCPLVIPHHHPPTHSVALGCTAWSSTPAPPPRPHSRAVQVDLRHARAHRAGRYGRSVAGRHELQRPDFERPWVSRATHRCHHLSDPSLHVPHRPDGRAVTG